MNTLLRKLMIAGMLVLGTGSVYAEFDSGSDGSDGALAFGEGMGDIVFDPDNFDPPLDADRDGVYHFTTIDIGAGTNLHLRADVMGHKPMIWLASGDVTIEGAIHFGVTGTDGEIPGVGGFYGGTRGGDGYGQGPGGGAPSESDSMGQLPDNEHINPYLIPLVGGSGTGAGTSDDGDGGAGAFLLASSGAIRNDGSFIGLAWPELKHCGNLRLIANSISGAGYMDGMNILRMEAFEHSTDLNVFAAQTIRTRPSPVFRQSAIEITVIDSVGVDQSKPGANKGEPDLTINSGEEVIISVTCYGVPAGKSVRVVGWNDTVGRVEALTGPLMEDGDNTTRADCKMVIPTGNTTFMAQVVMDEP